jgi:hypothetical protein
MTLLPWGTVDGSGRDASGEGAPLGPRHLGALRRDQAGGEPRASRAGVDAVDRRVAGMAQQFLPSAAIAVLGGWFAEILTAAGRSNAWKLRSAALFGVGLLALAYLLQAGYTPAGGGLLGRATVPFSKWFFSPAYCLLAAGTGGCCWAGFYWMIDVRRAGRG